MGLYPSLKCMRIGPRLVPAGICRVAWRLYEPCLRRTCMFGGQNVNSLGRSGL
jgi:hypothetical protein